jgi:hypothetical protein
MKKQRRNKEMDRWEKVVLCSHSAELEIQWAANHPLRRVSQQPIWRLKGNEDADMVKK